MSYASLFLWKKLLAQIGFLNLWKKVSQLSLFGQAKSQASIYTEPFRHIDSVELCFATVSFAELVQQAGLGSASAELLSAVAVAALASKRNVPEQR